MSERVLQFRGRFDDGVIEDARRTPVDVIADRLGLQLRRQGQEWAGPCPVCGGTDRFSINTAKDVWHCRCCDRGGDVIELVRHAKDKTTFAEAIEFITGRSRRQQRKPDPALAAEHERKRREKMEKDAADEAQRTEYALRIWNAGKCIYNTLAEAYLKSRHCDGQFPPDRDAVFRFHPRCVFGDQRLPGLLTLLRDVQTDEPKAVHRTALTPDGQKIDRKVIGPCRGAVAKLWPQNSVGKTLFIAEGVENALSAALRFKMKPAWACISAGGLEHLPPIPGVERLIILVDHDANERGQRAAQACSRVWTRAGRTVVRLVPQKVGADFNDIVCEAAS